MTEIQELAVSLGWSYKKSKKGKQQDNTFNKFNKKKNRRINNEYKYNQEKSSKMKIFELNERIRQINNEE